MVAKIIAASWELIACFRCVVLLAGGPPVWQSTLQVIAAANLFYIYIYIHKTNISIVLLVADETRESLIEISRKIFENIRRRKKLINFGAKHVLELPGLTISTHTHSFPIMKPIHRGESCFCEKSRERKKISNFLPPNNNCPF